MPFCRIAFVLLLVRVACGPVVAQNSAHNQFYPIADHANLQVEVENQELGGRTEHTGAMVQNTDGVMFIGLPTGVQVLLGDNTHLAPTRSRQPAVTALAFDAGANRVYVGLRSGFGYVQETAQGEYQFVRLDDKVPAADRLRLGTITQVFVLPNEVAFYSAKGMLVLSKADAYLRAVHIGDLQFWGAIQINNNIYLNTPNRGYLLYANGRQHYPQTDQNMAFSGPNNQVIFQKRLTAQNTLVGFNNNTVVLFKGGLANPWVQIDSASAAQYGDIRTGVQYGEYFIIGTSRKGCYLLKPNRPGAQATVVNQLNTRTGLQSNVVFDLLLDNFSRLWIAHDASYSIVYVNVPLNQYQTFTGQVNSLTHFNGRLYVATDDGVYYLPDSPEALMAERAARQNPAPPAPAANNRRNQHNNRASRRVQPVPRQRPSPARNRNRGNATADPRPNDTPEIALGNNFNGWEYRQIDGFQTTQCHQLFTWKNRLFVATNDGVFEISETGRRRILNRPCRFVHVRGNEAVWYVVEDYHVMAYEWQGTDDTPTDAGEVVLPFAGAIPRLIALEQDNTGEFWLLAQDSLYMFRQAEEIATPRKLRGVVALPRTQTRATFYRAGTNLFTRMGGQVLSLSNKTATPVLGELFRLRNSATFTMAGDNNRLWVALGDSLYFYLKQNNALVQKHASRYLNLVPGIGLSHLDPQGNIWVAAARNVFKLLEPEREPITKQVSYRTFITFVLLGGKPFFGGEVPSPNIAEGQVLELPYGDYTLKFNLFAPAYMREGMVTFLYRFGENEEWRPTQNTYVEFPLQGFGSHYFEVVAVDAFGNRSQKSRIYRVYVSPPVWFTWYAYLVYVLAAVGVFLLVSWQRERNIRHRNAWLETEVERQTREIRDQAEVLHQQKEELLATNNQLDELNKTILQQQQKLIETEKLAAAGTIAANVAHELNTPLGAIKGANHSLATALPTLVRDLPPQMQGLAEPESQAMGLLVDRGLREQPQLSAREERELQASLEQALAETGLDEAYDLATSLMKLGASLNDVQAAMPLLQHPRGPRLLKTLSQVGAMGRSLSNIDNQVEKAKNIILALKQMDATHPDAEMRPEPVDVAASIEAVLELYQNHLKQGARLETDFKIRPVITADPAQLAQVWTHILRNAIQALKGQGRLSIAISADTLGYIQIGFADTGPGVPHEIREDIFKPFFTTKAKGEAQGMGLTHSRQIVERHGGTLSLNSQPGHTEFVVRLPASPK